MEPATGSHLVHLLQENMSLQQYAKSALGLMDTAMSKNSAAISDLPFPVKKVSPEIRMMIYAYNLIIQHDDKRPALLVALDGDKDYQEAYMLYKRINYTVNKQNAESFKAMHISKVLGIRHFKVVFPLKFQV